MAHDLIATFITIAGDCQLAAAGGTEISPHDLFDRVKAMARGGFTGMGFGDRDLRYWLTKYDIGDLRQLLDDSGIRHIELEGVVDWFTTGERRQAADRNIDEILSWAAELGALHVKAAFDFVGGADCPHGVLVNEWAKVADRALVLRKLAHWQQDADLAGVRDKPALAPLPAEERAEWEKLWAEVADLLRRLDAAKPAAAPAGK